MTKSNPRAAVMASIRKTTLGMLKHMSPRFQHQRQVQSTAKHASERLATYVTCANFGAIDSLRLLRIDRRGRMACDWIARIGEKRNF